MSQSAKKLKDEADEFATKNRLRLWLKLLKLTRQIESELRDNLRVEFDTLSLIHISEPTRPY